MVAPQRESTMAPHLPLPQHSDRLPDLSNTMCGKDDKPSIKKLRSSEEGLQKMEGTRDRQRHSLDPFSDWQSPLNASLVSMDRSLKKRWNEDMRLNTQPSMYQESSNGPYVDVLWRGAVDSHGQYQPNNGHYRARKLKALRERSMVMGGIGRQRTLSNLQTPTTGSGKLQSLPVDRKQFQKSVAQDLQREFTHLLSRSNTKLDTIAESAAARLSSALAQEDGLPAAISAVKLTKAGPFSEKLVTLREYPSPSKTLSDNVDSSQAVPGGSSALGRSPRRERSSLAHGQVSKPSASRNLEPMTITGKEALGIPGKDMRLPTTGTDNAIFQRLPDVPENDTLTKDNSPRVRDVISSVKAKYRDMGTQREDIGATVERQPTRFRELFGSEAYKRQETNLREVMANGGGITLKTTSYRHHEHSTKKLAKSVEKFARKVEEDAQVAAIAGKLAESKNSLTRLRFTSTTGEMMSIPLYAQAGTISWLNGNSANAPPPATTANKGDQPTKVSRKKTEMVIALNSKGKRQSKNRPSLLQEALTTFKYNSQVLGDKSFRLGRVVEKPPSARRRNKASVSDKSTGSILVRHKILPRIAGKRILNR